MSGRVGRLAITCLVLALALAGCQQQRQRPAVQNGQSWTNQGTSHAPPVVGNPNVSTMEFNDLDPCAGRLHDIEGQLLNYYVQKHHWPDRIDELKAYADPGEETDYTCPVSHQRYVYVRGGLVKPGDARRLMVFDSTPAHNGMRYGITVSYANGREAMHTTVIGIPEQQFASYTPAPAIQPATLPAVPQRQRAE